MSRFRGAPVGAAGLITANRALTLVCGAALTASASGCACAPQPHVVATGSATERSTPEPTALTPNDRGYVRVESMSGSIGCSVIVDIVACQRLSGQWPADHGRGRVASVSADGDFRWVDADLGELQGRVRLHRGAFTTPGWTIIAGPLETRFVNTHNGHGMACTDRGVSPF